MGKFSDKLGKRKSTPRSTAATQDEVRDAVRSLLRRPDGRLALRLVEAIGERVDATAREAPGSSRWACAAGCNFCCHIPVVATPPELVRLARAVDAHPDAARLRARILANAERVDELEEEQLFASRLPCALLDEHGRCSVYAARPLACRAHVSFSREPCEAAHLDDARTDAGFDGDPFMQQVRTDADTHLATCLITAGLDGMGYELHDGLARALELDPRRWAEPEAFVACRTLSDRVAFDAELRVAIADES
ncbi:MAG TPA: YkgJ family cysteine cluster protein [Enhygromyxa sp.]|nr:YkgJ family cysteine cluster protein [Enhygromyxa sp.]